MIELYLVTQGKMEEILVESIVWSGERYRAPRKISVRALSPHNLNHKAVNVVEGNTVLFKWKGVELFRGIVFNQLKSKNGLYTFTAYDNMQYLLLNKKAYVFKSKRADQMFLRALQDFQVSYETISNTGFVFKNRVFPNPTSIYDIGLTTLIETHKRTGKRFRIASKQGKVSLLPVNTSRSMWVLEYGKNLVDYSLATSIDETATRVHLEAGEEKKKISVVVEDKEGIKSFGVLQYYEKVSDKINKAQLKERANQMLKSKGGIKKELSIDALGVPELVSGEAVRVIDETAPIGGNYFVESDTHTFKGESHTMTLKVVKDNDYPEAV